MKEFLEKHKTKLLIGAGAATTIAAYVCGFKKGYFKGNCRSTELLMSALYADHDATIGEIYRIVEKNVEPKDMKKLIEQGHKVVKKLEKM